MLLPTTTVTPSGSLPRSTPLVELRSWKLRSSPVCERSVRPTVHVPATRLGDFADLRETRYVHRDAEARPLIRVRLAVLEIQALGQVLDRPTAIVVLHQHGTGERRQTVDERGRRDGAREVRDDPD